MSRTYSQLYSCVSIVCVRVYARELDRRFSPAGTTPILDRLRHFTTTRGLVFGGYGEASADVHGLISAAADARAEQVWRPSGARSVSEMRGFIIATMRRRVGLRAVQEMARHRLSRMHYIGVSRQVIQERPQRRAQTSPTIYDETYFFLRAPAGERARGWLGRRVRCGGGGGVRVGVRRRVCGCARVCECACV